MRERLEQRLRATQRLTAAPPLPTSLARFTTGKGATEIAKWRRAYELLMTHPDIVPGSPVHVAMYEPRHVPPQERLPPDATHEEQRAFYRRLAAARPSGCIFPRMYLALTRGGSVVGVAAVVVHT